MQNAPGNLLALWQFKDEPQENGQQKIHVLLYLLVLEIWAAWSTWARFHQICNDLPGPPLWGASLQASFILRPSALPVDRFTNLRVHDALGYMLHFVDVLVYEACNVEQG